MQDKKRLIFAHRGLSDKNAPENSIAAFRRAVDAGLGIELDVRLTKDRIPVVFHDKTLRRMCSDPRKISALTLEELKKLRLSGTGQTIPTLAEALEAIDGRVPLLVETKLPKRHIWFHTLERMMLPILRSYSGELLLQSFNKYSMRFIKRKLPEIQCGILSGSLYPEPEGFDFISYKLSGLTPQKAASLRRKYPRVFVWTLVPPDENTLDHVFNELKLDGIIL